MVLIKKKYAKFRRLIIPRSIGSDSFWRRSVFACKLDVREKENVITFLRASISFYLWNVFHLDGLANAVMKRHSTKNSFDMLRVRTRNLWNWQMSYSKNNKKNNRKKITNVVLRCGRMEMVCYCLLAVSKLRFVGRTVGNHFAFWAAAPVGDEVL